MTPPRPLPRDRRSYSVPIPQRPQKKIATINTDEGECEVWVVPGVGVVKHNDPRVWTDKVALYEYSTALRDALTEWMAYDQDGSWS